MEVVSHEELYRIINRAISTYGDGSDVTREIKIFQNKYHTRKQQNPQINIFEEKPPLTQDVENAVAFCRSLNRYGEITEIDAKQEDETEEFYRKFYSQIQQYKDHLTPKNKRIYDIIIEEIKKHLPEYGDEVLLKNLNGEIQATIQRKRAKDKLGYEIRAQDFFNHFLHNDRVKGIRNSREKMELYQGCLKIVDCLPKENFSRTAKYEIKRDLNQTLMEIAQDMGIEYKEIAQKAQVEVTRYQRAIDNIREHLVTGKPFPSQRKLSPQQLARRKQEEYLHK